MSERVALVTGGSRGLGRVMALALAKAGHRVVLTATDEAALEETRRASGAPDRVSAIALDLSEGANLDRLVHDVESTVAPVDILVANAGTLGARREGPLDLDLADIRRMFEINTFAAIGLIHRLAPGMVRRGWGRIVYVSTSLDTMLEPAVVAYGMTKAAGEAFIAALAGSLRATGVTANVLLPGGATATRMTRDFGDPRTLLPPEIMAAPIVWLASDAANGVTGRRFIAARWNAALRDAQAAQASSAPAAWAGHGAQAVKPTPVRSE
jgi:NAD(P)-dependent dehydrogenase (short-subunit alcohol dehydrogenase family)